MRHPRNAARLAVFCDATMPSTIRFAKSFASLGFIFSCRYRATVAP
jgi:hypothetical protein